MDAQVRHIVDTVGEFTIVANSATYFGMPNGAFLIAIRMPNGALKVIRKVEFRNGDNFIASRNAIVIAEAMVKEW